MAARIGYHRSPGASYAAIAIAVAAVAVRFVNLGRESLWLDEGFTWRLTRLPLGDIWRASGEDVHPPLFGWLERVVALTCGDGEFALRALSAIASCFAMWFTARVARRAFGRTAALAAAALVALSAFQVHYAQEARSYALLGCLALASSDALLATLATGSPLAAAAWAAATLALLYTHAHGLFVVLAQVLLVAWLLRTERADRRVTVLFAPALFVGLAYAPWLGVLASQARRVAAGFWLARPSLLDPLRTLAEFAGSVPLLVLLGPLVVIGAVRSLRGGTRERATARALVLLLATVPLVVPFVASFVGPPVYLTRAAITASLALAVLAAGGWAELAGRARQVLTVLVLLACLPPLVDVHVRTYKEPWRDAVRWLDRQARAGDLVLVTAPWYRDGVFAYYHLPMGAEIRRVPGHEGAFTPEDVANLGPLLARHPRVWLVRARADDPQGLLPAALAAGRSVIARREWSVFPMGLARARPVGAIEIFCYAAPEVPPTAVTPRP